MSIAEFLCALSEVRTPYKLVTFSELTSFLNDKKIQFFEDIEYQSYYAILFKLDDGVFKFKSTYVMMGTNDELGDIERASTGELDGVVDDLWDKYLMLEGWYKAQKENGG